MKYIACLLCATLFLFGSMNICLADGYSGTDDSYEEVYADDFAEEESEADPSIMYICGQPYVRLRQTDSTERPYVDKMPYGSMVTVVVTQINDVGEEWSLVIYNEQYGYCMTKYLTDEMLEPASEAYPQTMEEAFGTTLLQQGNSKPSYRVKNLQLCLIEGGFLHDASGADGYFGKKTYRALCAFQKAQGLDQAGRAGKTTKTRLWYMYSGFLMENGVMQ